ncbi:MAG TPA: MFS transporter [Vicinamibacteria bacterium]
MFPPIALGVIMATLDASVVNIALPTLQRTLHAGLGTIEWVALAYSLTLTGLLLSAGRLADARGRRSVYGLGLLLFTAASLLCGLAPTVQALIALRVLQGAAAALVSANGSALLVQAFPESERGRALGAFGAMVGVGLALGPPLGGLVVANASWRWIFLVNLPLGLLAFWLLRRRVPRDGPVAEARGVQGVPTLLWAAGLATLMLALTRGAERGWAAPGVGALVIGGVTLLAAFALTQRRAPHPLLPLDVLTGPLGGTLTLTFLGQVLSVAVGFHLPLVMEALGGWTAARSGAWLAILPTSALLCAPVAGRVADRIGTRPLTVAGMLLTAIGMAALARMEPGLPAAPLALGMALVGVGLGIYAIPNASALLSLVPPARLGLASGLQGTARNLGIASGVALTGAYVTMSYRSLAGRPLALGGPEPVDTEALRLATQQAFAGLAGIALLAAGLAWAVGSAGRTKPAAGDTTTS